ncbi:MAG: hypothetical protein ACOYJW_00950 [Candidatus Omnitrophota bacterium]
MAERTSLWALGGCEMKVKELIEKLKALPAEARVLVQGYEDGFDNVVAVKEISVAKRADAADYNGEYEESDQNAETAAAILGNRR